MEECRGGVQVIFGENVSFVFIENLNRAYRLFLEPGYYSVEVLFMPVDYWLAKPDCSDLFSLTDQVSQEENAPSEQT